MNGLERGVASAGRVCLLIFQQLPSCSCRSSFMSCSSSNSRSWSLRHVWTCGCCLLNLTSYRQCTRAPKHTHTHAYTGSGNWQQMITKLATKSGANLILMPSTTLSSCCGATLIWLPQIRLAGAIWGLPFPLLLLLLLLVACAIWRLWAGLGTSSQDLDEGDGEDETKLAKCLYNPELLTALTSIDFWRRQWWCALSGCCILFSHSCYLWIWNEISKVITVNRVLCLFTICEKTEKE